MKTKKSILKRQPCWRKTAVIGRFFSRVSDEEYNKLSIWERKSWIEKKYFIFEEWFNGLRWCQRNYFEWSHVLLILIGILTRGPIVFALVYFLVSRSR